MNWYPITSVTNWLLTYCLYLTRVAWGKLPKNTTSGNQLKITDDGFLIHTVSQRRPEIFKTIPERYPWHIKTNYGQNTITVFDECPRDPQMIGTKTAEKLCRTRTNCSSHTEFEEIIIATSKEKLFSNE